MIVGVSSLAYRWSDLPEACRRCVEEFGLDLIEFPCAQLREEEFAALGLRSQEWGVSLGLRAPLDLGLPALAGGTAGVLSRLRERCEEALAGYVVLEVRPGPGEKLKTDRLAVVLAASLPAYQALGVEVCLKGLPAGEFLALVERELTPAPDYCLDTADVPPVDRFGALAPHLGCVHVSQDPLAPAGQERLRSLLQNLQKRGFRGPFVLAFPAEGARYGEVAAWLGGGSAAEGAGV